MQLKNIWILKHPIERAMFKVKLQRHWWCHCGLNGFFLHSVHLVVISEVKLKLSCTKHGFWKLSIFTRFVSTLYNKHWSSYDNFKIWPTFDSVKSSTTSWVYNLACTIRHPHLYSSRVLVRNNFSNLWTFWSVSPIGNSNTSWGQLWFVSEAGPHSQLVPH